MKEERNRSRFLGPSVRSFKNHILYVECRTALPTLDRKKQTLFVKKEKILFKKCLRAKNVA